MLNQGLVRARHILGDFVGFSKFEEELIKFP